MSECRGGGFSLLGAALAIGLVGAIAGTALAGPLEDAEAAFARSDYATAERLFRLLADQGDASAQLHLGFMYAKGQGVPQNEAEAAKWYRKAADQGEANAQVNLGFMYANGRGVPQNYVQAHMWLNLAASGSASNKENRAEAAKYRDSIATRMTPAQIAEAQAMAKRCVESNYKDCR
jgi:TPR repeat protein